MKQPEAKFKSRLVECFESVFPAGWCTYVRAPKYGVPDLFFSIPGHRGFWLEGKANGNPLSSYQYVQIKKMIAAGESVLVVDANVGAVRFWKEWTLTVTWKSPEHLPAATAIIPATLMKTKGFWERLAA